MNRWPLAEFDWSTFLIVFFFKLLFSPPFMCSLAGRRLHWGSFLFFVMLGRLRDHRRRSRGSKGSVAPPPPVEICESPTPRFGAEKTFTDVLDNTCGHRRLQNAHFLPSDGTQELPKKHHEAGPPEQLPTDALSQIDYVHTWNFKMMWTAEIQILNKDAGMIVGLVIAI